MDSQLKIEPSSKPSSKLINNIHRMPWLKKRSASQNTKMHQVPAEKDGQITSKKKTDEDYFQGTREGKKAKKKREKKVKSVLTFDELEDLVGRAQQYGNHEDELIPVVPADFSNEETIRSNKPENINIQDTEIVSKINNNTNINTNINSVWSMAIDTADKLFPNVESITIDRFEEEEMLSRAIAESIATIQLEKFKQVSPEKGQRWEALYGDNDDDGGWDNVRRNLPPALENINSGLDPADQSKICDDNNNSNGSNKSGILKNRDTSLNRFTKDIKDSDFCFRTCSESSMDDSKSEKSLKSVSFKECIDVKIRSSESSENELSESLKCLNNNEIEGGPKIDKFGRVDGYSERRLFMGKGARMKEQEYIQNQCNLGGGDAKNENFYPALQTIAIKETQTYPLTVSQSSSPQKTAPNLEKDLEKSAEITTVAENYNKTSETRIQKIESISEAPGISDTKKSAIATLQCPENLQSQKTIPDLKKEPEMEKTISVESMNKTAEPMYKKIESNSKITEIVEAKTVDTKTLWIRSENSQTQSSMQNVENSEMEKAFMKYSHGRPKIQRDINQTGDTVEKPNNSATQLNMEKPLSKSSALNQNSAANTLEQSCTNSSPLVKLKPQSSEKTKWKPIANETQTFRGKENVGSHPIVPFKLSNGVKTREKQISDCKQNFIKSGVQKIDSDHKNSGNRIKGTSILDEVNSPSERRVITEKKGAKDLPKKNKIQDTMSRNLAAILKTDTNISTEKIVEEEIEPVGRCLVPTWSKDDECTANFSTINPEFLDSAGAITDERFLSAAHQNLLVAGVSCSDLSYDTDPQNSQSQPLDRDQEIQLGCLRSGNQIYQTTTVNQLPNINTSTHAMLPNYENGAERQMVRTEFADILNGTMTQNSQYHCVGQSVNAGDNSVSNFVESRENLASSRSIQDSVPMTEINRIASYERAQNYGDPNLMAQVAPGLMKTLQLPPGFTRKEPTQRFNVDGNRPAINLTAVKRNSENIGPEKGSFKEQKSLSRNTYNWRQPAPEHFVSPAGRWNENSAPINRSSTKTQKNHSVTQTAFQCEDPMSIENRKVPYPILGAAQNSHKKYRDYGTKKPDSGVNPEFRRDAVTDRFSSPYNNNYSTQSTNTIPEMDNQGVSNSSPNSGISHFGFPVICQTPDVQYSESSNWKHNANLMNPPHTPMNFIHNYEIPMGNFNLAQQSLPVNVPPGCFKLPFCQNEGFQQCPMNMMRSVQIPMCPIPFPHLLDPEGNGSGNLRPENAGPAGMDFSINNYDPSVEMAPQVQRSIAGAHPSANYNLSQANMRQFMPNQNFYETECNMVPINVQDPQMACNNQMERTSHQAFDTGDIGRGRGRVPRQDLL